MHSVGKSPWLCLLLKHAASHTNSWPWQLVISSLSPTHFSHLCTGILPPLPTIPGRRSPLSQTLQTQDPASPSTGPGFFVYKHVTLGYGPWTAGPGFIVARVPNAETKYGLIAIFNKKLVSKIDWEEMQVHPHHSDCQPRREMSFF